METLILIGPMGSGKTTLGKKLAKELDVPFSDTDKLVARDHGAIVDIFINLVEEYFRTLETSALIKALELGGVIATPGMAPATRCALWAAPASGSCLSQASSQERSTSSRF